jgi:hypothetical protein
LFRGSIVPAGTIFQQDQIAVDRVASVTQAEAAGRGCLFLHIIMQ